MNPGASAWQAEILTTIITTADLCQDPVFCILIWLAAFFMWSDIACLFWFTCCWFWFRYRCCVFVIRYRWFAFDLHVYMLNYIVFVWSDIAAALLFWFTCFDVIRYRHAPELADSPRETGLAYPTDFLAEGIPSSPGDLPLHGISLYKGFPCIRDFCLSGIPFIRYLLL